MMFDRMFRNPEKTCNDFVGLALDHMSKYLLFTRSELAEELLLVHIRPPNGCYEKTAIHEYEYRNDNFIACYLDTWR